MLALTAFVVLLSPTGTDVLDDPRLEKPISVRISAETVRDACKTLSAAAGVTLRPEPSVKSDRITLLAQNRPAKEVLRMISSHFSWEWKKSAEGFVLGQSPAQKSAEDSRCSKEICKQYYASQERSRKLAGAAPPPFDQAAQRLLALGEQFDKLMPKGDEELSEQQEKELSDLEEELSGLQDKLDPMARFVRTVFAAMNDSQLLELDARGRIVFSYLPTRAQHGLGAVSSAAQRFLGEEQRKRDWIASTPAARTVLARELRRSFRWAEGSSNAEIATVRIVFRTDGQADVWAVTTVLDKDGRIIGSGTSWLPNDQDEDSSKPSETESSAPSLIRSTMTQKLEIDKARAVQQFGPQAVVSRFLAVMFGSPESPDFGDLFRLRSELLLTIADAAKMPLIADSYDDSADLYTTHLLKLLTAPKTVGEAFDEYAKYAECKAQLSNGWVTLRTNDWELARAKTVPADALAALTAAKDRNGGVTIGPLLAFISGLSDLQFRSTMTDLVSELAGLGPVRSGSVLHMLKAVALLSPVQWEKLKSGAGVAYGDLPIEARREISEALLQSAGPGAVSGLEYPFADSDFDTEAAANEDVMQDAQSDSDDTDGEISERGAIAYEWNLPPAEDQEITQLLPDGLPPGALLTLTIEKKQGASVKLNVDGRPVSFAGSVSMIAGLVCMLDPAVGIPDLPLPQNLKIEGWRPSSLEHWEFKFTLGGTTLRGCTIVSTSSSGPFGSVEALPAELGQRLRKAQASFKKMFQYGGDADSEPPPPPRTFHQR